MRALLDVNVLIALLDSAHIHHDQAMAWLKREHCRRLGLVPADAEWLHPHHVAA